MRHAKVKQLGGFEKQIMGSCGLASYYSSKKISYPIAPSDADNSFISKVVDGLAQTINHLF